MARDSKVTVESFARQCHGQMIPLNKTCSYFSALPLEETALRKLLYEPIAAVPPEWVTHSRIWRLYLFRS